MDRGRLDSTIPSVRGLWIEGVVALDNTIPSMRGLWIEGVVALNSAIYTVAVRFFSYKNIMLFDRDNF